MSVAPTIAIDGHVLNEHYAISGIHRPWPQVSANTEEVDGRDGDVLRGLKLGTRGLSFTLWAFDADHERLRESFAWLMELLTETAEHELVFGDEGGRVRTVTLADYEPAYDEYAERASLQLDFTMHDPRLRMPTTRELAIPSGGTASFFVGHARPRLTLTAASAVRNSSTRLWGVTFDDQVHLRVELPTASATSVAVDCANRKVAIGGATGTIELESDWPRLVRGMHVVRMTQGAGAAKLTIRETCL